jgi:hypothetical protein
MADRSKVDWKKMPRSKSLPDSPSSTAIEMHSVACCLVPKEELPAKSQTLRAFSLPTILPKHASESAAVTDVTQPLSFLDPNQWTARKSESAKKEGGFQTADNHMSQGPWGSKSFRARIDAAT